MSARRAKPAPVVATAPVTPDWICVLRPQLPSERRLRPYLKRIDASRAYSNWGPLTEELEGRLSAHLELPDGAVVTASSGTAAIVAALLARAGRATAERPVAVIPAFTFVATALAAEQAGYRVVCADVDADTWALDPDRLSRSIDTARTGVVIVVAPFGRPIRQAPWRKFERTTGIPVVIDAAAGFEAIEADPAGLLGDIPVVLSFHATKSFSTGEGGCVIQTDAAHGEQVIRALNFGFFATRETTGASINGKLSEYHAAIGLAELDQWPAKRQAFADVAATYRQTGTSAGLGRERIVALPDVSSPYVLLRAGDAREAVAVQATLAARDIDSRLWYGHGVHRHPYFAASAAHGALPVTDDFAPRLIGLPVAVDLPQSSVARVVSAIVEAIA